MEAEVGAESLVDLLAAQLHEGSIIGEEDTGGFGAVDVAVEVAAAAEEQLGEEGGGEVREGLLLVGVQQHFEQVDRLVLRLHTI